MSRCMPFPPPGYYWNGVGGQALLQLLELRRVRAVAKKERRRRKKEKRKHKKYGEVGKKSCDHERKHRDEPGLENSTISEEHGQRIIPPYNSYDKRHGIKRETPQLYQNGFTDHGSITSEGMVLSTYHEVDFMGRSELSANKNFETSESGLLGTESEYRKLIVNWIGHPLQMVQTDFDDQEWLSKRNLCTSERMQNITLSIDFYQGSYTYARYLPDADIYALPFTLPF